MIHRLILLLLLGVYAMSAHADPTYPQWWIDRGVVEAQPPAAGTPEYEAWMASNYAPINQGQLLNMAAMGIEELDERLLSIGGAGFTLDDLRDPAKTPEYYAPVALGQLKFVSALFFQRFSEIGFGPGVPGWPRVADQNNPGQFIAMPLESPSVIDGANPSIMVYPWAANTGSRNLSIANLGQAKFLFMWNLDVYTTIDTDADKVKDYVEFSLGLDHSTNTDSDWDGLPDDWEIYYFGSLTQDAEGDADNDGVSNLDEYINDDDPAFLSIFRHAPLVWLNADTYEGSALVALWADSSGNDNDAVQSNTDHQPSWVEMGYFESAAISYDGDDDSLVVESLDCTLSSYSVVVLMQVRNLEAHTFEIGETSSGDTFQFVVSSAGAITVGTDSATSMTTADGVIKGNHWHLIVFTYDSGNGTLYVNGDKHEKPGMAAPDSWGNLVLGEEGEVDGKIAEFILFDEALSNAQVDQLKRYFDAKTRSDEDSDRDGLLDRWEIRNGADLTLLDGSYSDFSGLTVSITTPENNSSF